MWIALFALASAVYLGSGYRSGRAREAELCQAREALREVSAAPAAPSLIVLPSTSAARREEQVGGHSLVH